MLTRTIDKLHAVWLADRDRVVDTVMVIGEIGDTYGHIKSWILVSEYHSLWSQWLSLS